MSAHLNLSFVVCLLVEPQAEESCGIYPFCPRVEQQQKLSLLVEWLPLAYKFSSLAILRYPPDLSVPDL